MADPVSWLMVEKGWRVVGSDGAELGTVDEVLGDPDADIFNGLVLSLGRLSGNRYLPAERVRGIWPDRVEVDASAAELERLPDYEEPVAGRIVADESFLTRLRRRFGR